MDTLWLPRALDVSRARGFLGPQPIERHRLHAEGFAECWEREFEVPPGRTLDLGSGGGLPGLVLLARWQNAVVFLDAMQKRTRLLSEVLAWPDAPTGGTVITERAEVAARLTELDGAFDLVVARSFGSPAVTAECAARFLRLGGSLIVSEPPEGSERRWSAEGLARLGLQDLGPRNTTFHYRLLCKTDATPGAIPRASGAVKKHPLF